MEDAEVIEEILADPYDKELEENTWNYTLGVILSSTTAWLLLACLMIVVLLWNRIQNYLDNMYEKNQQREYDAKMHKDPDWIVSNHERMDRARRKMQEQYTVQASEYQVKAAEREKQKHLEKLTKCTMDVGHRLSDADSSKSHRPDYNPLVGDSSGRYKPQKKSKCSGGGCG